MYIIYIFTSLRPYVLPSTHLHISNVNHPCIHNIAIQTSAYVHASTTPYISLYRPINEYDLDLADLVVNFEPCPRYENKDGAHCNVGVYFGGSEPNKPRLKTVEMAFEEGRWKARVFNGVFTAVVKPFYGGTADEAELAREDAYRAHFKLQTRESIALEMRAAKQKALASKDHYEGTYSN